MSLPLPANYFLATVALLFSADCGYKAYRAYAHGIVSHKSKSWHSPDAKSSAAGSLCFCLVFLRITYRIAVGDDETVR